MNLDEVRVFANRLASDYLLTTFPSTFDLRVAYCVLSKHHQVSELTIESWLWPSDSTIEFTKRHLSLLSRFDLMARTPGSPSEFTFVPSATSKKP